ncbi:helix-turn-helix domain-containing protein [Nesterenkonia sp. E16_7]|uniref:helix-turn-helix domain-containing protein n=1 Tax=unclassified Nesterenkonia TaxID=2629769 RepID=UPI001A92F41A|nr:MULTISPECIES: helix-turn-helix domain-containing protein [unclassified Nesterenkonia]MBO0596259.1 helix-turn-helix domain-containing protein [Nesterenkonia sp. E16_10]MBO0597146.1 helix-turn-helix domain-containing protein [Nesterenkonia sp. E16_7]
MNDPDSIDELLKDFPDLAQPKEIADLLRVKLNTVNQWIRDGRLSSINAGRRVNRIMKPKLREFLLHADELPDTDSEGDAGVDIAADAGDEVDAKEKHAD